MEMSHASPSTPVISLYLNPKDIYFSTPEILSFFIFLNLTIYNYQVFSASMFLGRQNYPISLSKLSCL